MMNTRMGGPPSIWIASRQTVTALEKVRLQFGRPGPECEPTFLRIPIVKNLVSNLDGEGETIGGIAVDFLPQIQGGLDALACGRGVVLTEMSVPADNLSGQVDSFALMPCSRWSIISFSRIARSAGQGRTKYRFPEESAAT